MEFRRNLYGKTFPLSHETAVGICLRRTRVHRRAGVAGSEAAGLYVGDHDAGGDEGQRPVRYSRTRRLYAPVRPRQHDELLGKGGFYAELYNSQFEQAS